MRHDLTVKGGNTPAPQQPNFALATDEFRRSIAMAAATDPDSIPWGRYFTALWRFKVLALALFLAGGGVAYMVARSIPAQYETAAGVWVKNMTRQDGGVTPVRAEPSMTATAWLELVRSEPVLDSVVKKLRLNIRYANAADSVLFRTLSTAEQVPVGRYTLETDSTGRFFTLRDRHGTPLSTGTVGDSIGAEHGFRWAPESIHRPGPIAFDLVTFRDATMHLRDQLHVTLEEQGGLMRIGLTGTDPRRITSTVNQILSEFMADAEYRSKVHQLRIQESVAAQKELAEAAYKASLLELQSARVNNYLVDTRATQVGVSGQSTTGTLLAGYSERRAQKIQLDFDIRALDSTIVQVIEGSQHPNAFLPIPSVATKGSGLQQAVIDYQIAEAELQALRSDLTETNQRVITERNRVERLRRDFVIPAARMLREQLRQEAVMLSSRLDEEAQELRDIPVAVIRDHELQAEMEQRLKTLDLLRDRHGHAQMAVMSAVPDVQVGFPAIEPSEANKDTAIRAFGMILIAALGMAVAVPILLDRLDKKFRYPDQATRDLGLTILGTVPRIRKIKSWQSDPAEAVAVVEAFRTVRLALSNAFPAGEPITVAITSPGVGEGKSLVAENLALALSEGGYRTLLIDGDTRRGELHATFSVERRPGLLDHLNGSAALDQVVQVTTHPNLWLLASGTRFRHGPELLMAPTFKPMLEELRERFDAIVIDTPPLSAGVDPYVLSTAVGNMLLVLRTGKSDRKLAEAKLDLMDRLPVRVIGAVLNGVSDNRTYEYYSYVDGYAAESEDGDAPYLASPGSGKSLTTKRR